MYEKVEEKKALLYYEVANHAANGISTLALTFTLLGIALGIGTLSEHSLTPDTIQSIIKDLTKHFSLAFLTSVVGLPLSACIKAIIEVSYLNILSKKQKMEA